MPPMNIGPTKQKLNTIRISISRRLMNIVRLYKPSANIIVNTEKANVRDR